MRAPERGSGSKELEFASAKLLVTQGGFDSLRVEVHCRKGWPRCVFGKSEGKSSGKRRTRFKQKRVQFNPRLVCILLKGPKEGKWEKRRPKA